MEGCRAGAIHADKETDSKPAAPIGSNQTVGPKDRGLFKAHRAKVQRSVSMALWLVGVSGILRHVKSCKVGRTAWLGVKLKIPLGAGFVGGLAHTGQRLRK
jgi:hypothetical protein